MQERERYFRWPRLSDTRYSAEVPKGNGDMQAECEIEMRHLPAIWGEMGNEDMQAAKPGNGDKQAAKRATIRYPLLS